MDGVVALTNLNTLGLSQNRLNGTIPTELGLLTELSKLSKKQRRPPPQLSFS